MILNNFLGYMKDDNDAMRPSLTGDKMALHKVKPYTDITVRKILHKCSDKEQPKESMDVTRHGLDGSRIVVETNAQRLALALHVR